MNNGAILTKGPAGKDSKCIIETGMAATGLPSQLNLPNQVGLKKNVPFSTNVPKLNLERSVTGRQET